LGEFHR
jgi:beta-xylosidase